MGGCPTNSAKRSAKAERDSAAACASDSMVQSRAGYSCSAVSARPTYGSRRPDEPVRAALGQRLEIAAHHVDEHELADASQHAFAAHATLGFRQRRAEIGAERAAAVVVDADHARQRGQQRVVGPRIAAEEAAHEMRGLRRLGAHRDARPAGGRRRAWRYIDMLGGWRMPKLGGEYMRVAMRQHDDVAGVELDRRLALERRTSSCLP